MRPRGFIEWTPYAKSQRLLETVRIILADYAAQLPLTIRQIFYRLVGRYAYDKTERAYANLCELLNKARRASLIEWDAIRDDGFTTLRTPFFEEVEDIFATFRNIAHGLRLDRQKGQERRLFVWCEAAGMAPQLARIADPYGIAVLASGGFDSLTDKHRLAEEWALAEQPATVLHLGDYDPSGLSIFDSLAEDITAFAEHYGGDVDFVRIAVTLEQARAFNLPSAPPKLSDKRGFVGDETWQCEALDPRDLAAILREAIESRIDFEIYESVLADEEKTRQDVISRLERMA